MKIRFLIYLAIFLLIVNFSSASAGGPPEVSEMPALASVPSLPAIEVFGTPSPPGILEDAEASMPGIEFWQEKTKGKTTMPQPDKMPVNPTYAAIFAWPVRGRISSGFGPRGRSRHEGIDIPVPKGTPVQAAGGGVVAEARTYRGYGLTVIIDHENGTETLYAHCSSLAVQKGDSIVSGQVIAYAGNTGRSTASHVHFGVMVKGVFHNPIGYLKEPYHLAQK